MPTIYVCNLKPIERVKPDEVRAAVTESNFHTLCDQYGLDPALIKPARDHLEIRTAPQNTVPIFSLHYGLPAKAPLVVTQWREGERLANLLRVCASIASQVTRQHITGSREAFTIELSHEQCHDLGLLFAYELARWAAYKGEGVVRALDGAWYRLNTYKAFLPID